MVHEQFFRSKVDCPHFKFSRRMLGAHLCAKMENCVLVFGRPPQMCYVVVITVSGTDKQAAFSMAFHWHRKWYDTTALCSVNYSEGNQYGPDLSRWTDFKLFFTWKHSMKWQRPTARWILDKRNVSVPNLEYKKPHCCNRGDKKIKSHEKLPEWHSISTLRECKTGTIIFFVRKYAIIILFCCITMHFFFSNLVEFSINKWQEGHMEHD